MKVPLRGDLTDRSRPSRSSIGHWPLDIGNSIMTTSEFQHLSRPTEGEPITKAAGGGLAVPDRPIVPFIEGDGTGPDIWRAAQRVLDASVEKAYGGRRKIAWFEV